MSDSDVIEAVDANPVPSPPPVLAAVAAVSQAEPTVAERLAGILTLAVESSSKVHSDCVSCFAKFGFTAGAPAGCSCSLEARSADQRYVMTEIESNGCPAGHTGVDKQDQPNMLPAQPWSPT